MTPAHQHIIIGITGATGAIYALRALQVLRQLKRYQTHLIISRSGLVNCQYELGLSRKDLIAFADHEYHIDDISAPIASGSFPSHAMLIVPCSMKTLAAVAIGLCDNLISRSADVMLKERRPLALAVRETPLNAAHLKNMLAVTEMGGVIFPPLNSFYQQPDSIAAMVDHTVGRLLAQIGVATDLAPPWLGLSPKDSPK